MVIGYRHATEIAWAFFIDPFFWLIFEFRAVRHEIAPQSYSQ